MMIATRIALVVSLVGCAARPAPTTTASDTRVLELEARIAQLEAQPMQAEPRRRPKKPSPPPAGDPAVATELAEVQRRVNVLESSNDELWTQIETQRFGDLRAPDPRFALPSGTRRPQLDPAATYSVPVTNNPSLGDPTAKVTWVIGAELTEPYTRKLLETVAPLRQRYGADLRIVFKHNIVHDFGIASAMLLCAADQQGKFEQGTKSVIDIPLSERARFRLGPLTRALPYLDATARDKSLAGSCRQVVREDHLFAQKLGQTAVPYSFVNGRHLSGAQPAEAFAKLIDEELAKANTALGGKPARGYYDTLVKTGRKQP